ncbi:hypothetical protein HMPREF9104_00017 [Lentilactobacillus kisonensis F0435]|uniref:Uncharacterized protein n=1 Tax=Lentilactobacillus kisonensis F0435 TaxID=797516 RepID=H1LBQ7_9LACO|nr:hypothetical protein HMPREF9104_00017 [Lentilactobacillus kisonensis F0435]
MFVASRLNSTNSQDNNYWDSVVKWKNEVIIQIRNSVILCIKANIA